MVGTSEYSINDKVMPYARYSQHLESLNIMVKARNFLVFQGDVEAIASQNSRDLTKVIEQVSGSDEYKSEYERLKQEQDRAAENSTFNFNKKRGVTAEMKQYKEQREEAVKFEKMLQDKDKLIVDHTVWKLYNIHARIERANIVIEKYNSTLEREQDKQKQLAGDLQSLKQKQAQLQKESLKHDRLVSSKQKELNDRGAELIKIEQQMNHVFKKLNTVTHGRERLEKEKAKLATEVKDLTSQVDALKTAAAQLDQQIQESAAKASNIVLSKEQLHEYASLREKANAGLIDEHQKIKELKRTKTVMTDEIARNDEKVSDVTRRKAQLSERLDLVAEDKLKLEATLTGATQELISAESRLKNQSRDRARALQQEKEVEEQLTQVYQQLSQSRYDQRESEHKSRLREAIETMKRVYSGVHGKLIDLCRPTHRKYDTAVSIVLGKHLDAIVVDDSKTAIACIQYLKDQRVGLATFLPLDSLHVKPVNEKYRQIAKGARLAIDILQYDRSVERAIEFSCANTLVCDTLQIARHVCFDKQQKVKAVTLDGTVIHKAGMITGGTTDNLAVGSRRWEQKELETLMIRKTRLEEELAALSRERRQTSSDELLIAEIADLKSRITASREDFVSNARTRDSIQSELHFIAKERALLMGSHIERQEQCDRLALEIDSIQVKIRRLDAQIFADFCKRLNLNSIQDYETQQLKLHQDDNEKKLRFATQISRLENEIQFTNDQLAKLDTREIALKKQEAAETAATEQLKVQKANIYELNKACNEEIDRLRKTQSQAHDNSSRITADISGLKSELHSCNQVVDRAIKAMAGQESLIEKMNAESSDIFRRCKLEEICIPLVSGDMDSIPLDNSERITQYTNTMDIDGETQNASQSSVEVNFESLNESLKENVNPESVEADFNDKIKQMTADIELMHPNLKAIERLDGVETRMKETAVEFDKVRKEAKDLREQYLKVKQLRYDRFNKAYQHISTRIDAIYKELTKSVTHPLGGTAYLTLENSDEPYSEGIKYHAMPPMKRFRDMEQLSGGEKTMAALALLFAVHSYHQSPFFVLDEVDAALDNANVAKIARYLRNNADTSFQFIVISLKSSLYENSDSLVGIYRDLDEKSSAVLTLDLTQYAD